MEDKKNTAINDNGSIQNPAGHSDAVGTDSKQAQNESKYDSHSEKKPHQKTTVTSAANPDCVSHDNRDTTSEKPIESVDLEDDGSEDDDIENQTKPFPKSNSSSFPSIS